MTFREKAVEYLNANGLFPKQAEAVLAEVIKEGGSMIPILDQAAGGYPPMLWEVFSKTLDRVAIEWIDKHHPDHFARLFFAEDLTS